MVEYLSGGRIQGSSTAPADTTYETNFSSDTGWSSSSTSQLEVTNNELQIKQVTYTGNQINYDLSSQVSGSSLADSWVLRYDLEWSGSASSSPLFWINISDNTALGNENQDALSLKLYHGQSAGFSISKSDGIRPDQSGSGAVDLSPTTAIGYGTKYFIEHIRNGQDFTVNVRTGSHTGTLVCTGTISSFASTITGLKYFKIITYQGSGISGVLDNLEFWDNTTSTTTDEKTTLTNVPANTRFEDYTVRKIYRAKSVGFPNGTSGSGSDWTEVAFDSSTSANNGTASGNVVTRSSYPSSGDWTSYIRSSTHYLDPSEGGGEVYFTVSNNSHVSMGLEKSPYNEYPSGVYQSRDYSFHTTTATNNMYEKTSSYDGTDWNNATNEWRITMDSEGEVKYYYRENSSSSWGDPERTSNVVASGKYYVSVSVYSTSSCTCYIKSDASMAWVERGNA